MGIRRLAIPTYESGYTVELAYLERWSPRSGGSTPLAFLHRSGGQGTEGQATEEREEDYRRFLPRYRVELADLIQDRRFELVVSPPSSRTEFDPYRKEILTRGIARNDLTDCFTRKAGLGSGRKQSFDELIDSLAFSCEQDLTRARSTLIVDDYFVTGRTAAAVVSLLRSEGLSSDAQVTVACPLWVDGG